jgi:hypothetical protein
MLSSMSDRRRARDWAATIAAVTAGVAQPAAVFAQGCAMCKTLVGGPGDPLGVGINTSILFMMAMPFVMTGSVGAWIAYMYWRGGTSERDDVHSLTSPGEEVS